MLAGLEQACKSGDIRRTRRALQYWLRDFGPLEGNGSLLEFAAGLGDPAIRDSISALDSNVFRPASTTEQEIIWNGGAFWKQFEAWRKNWVVSGKNNRPSLTDLYARENRV
jgi:actin-related protein